MRNSKFGFTLTEALLAMAILGVIGALVIPQLAANTQKNEAGIILGNTVEQISLGVKNLIQHANNQSDDGSYFDTYSSITRGDLFGAGVNNAGDLVRGTNLFDIGKAFFGVENLSDTDNDAYSVSTYAGASDAFSRAINGAQKYRYEKTGAYIAILPTANNANELDTIIDVIAIDVNGANNPNKLGKDVFMFGLTNEGNMIPAGTQRFSNAVANNVVGGNIPTNGCNGNNVTNGLSCTARVVKNGFKIKY